MSANGAGPVRDAATRTGQMMHVRRNRRGFYRRERGRPYALCRQENKGGLRMSLHLSPKGRLRPSSTGYGEVGGESDSEPGEGVRSREMSGASSPARRGAWKTRVSALTARDFSPSGRGEGIRHPPPRFPML